jgi:hypothetical protein
MTHEQAHRGRDCHGCRGERSRHSCGDGIRPVGPTDRHQGLVAVLTADGNQFDSNWYDYDIVTEAVVAVLTAKPESAVGG